MERQFNIDDKDHHIKDAFELHFKSEYLSHLFINYLIESIRKEEENNKREKCGI